MNRILTFFLFLSITCSLIAGERTVEQAASIAAQFVNSQPGFHARQQAPAEASDMHLAYTGTVTGLSIPAYYIFNNPNQSTTVFVSADDRMLPVLGYTDTGSFDYNTANPSLRWWLSRYSRQLEALSVTEEMKTVSQVTATYTPIAPLLGKIEYDQEKPYSNLCPLDGIHRSLTGCVATAAAQVMRMWKYPAQGTGSHSYTSTELRKQVSADFNVPYDWDNMLESYKGTYTAVQAKAVATLMFHCGVACDMDYSYDNGSASLTDYMAAGLTKYFGYKVGKFVTQISKGNYPDVQFTPAEYSVRTSQILNYIYADIEQGRPVIMGGNDSDGYNGHEFVCDGRDSNGKLHINWGWSGDGNGYFAITALECDGYEFSSDLDAIIGLEPAQTEYVPVESISLNPAALTLKINEQKAVSATILPANSSVRIATWSSSDPAVATVSNGTVKGVSQGKTTISATVEGKKAEAVVVVTSEKAASQDFVLVTEENNLHIGDELLIVNEDNQVALGITQNKNNRAEAVVTINGNAIQLDETNTDVQILTLTQGAVDSSFGLMTTDGYLYAASSSKNYLRTQSRLTEDGSWTIHFDGRQAQITAQGNNSHNIICYNSKNRIFSAYLNELASVAVYARRKQTALPAVQGDWKEVRKIIRDGRLIILDGNREYNAQGILIQ